MLSEGGAGQPFPGSEGDNSYAIEFICPDSQHQGAAAGFVTVAFVSCSATPVVSRALCGEMMAAEGRVVMLSVESKRPVAAVG